MSYGPPPSDSDEDADYEGFMFGDDVHFDKPHKHTRTRWVQNSDQELYDAVLEGDLTKVKQQIELLNFDVENALKGGYTLLLHACAEGHVHIVRYLLKELSANPNAQDDSVTPLIAACGRNTPEPTETVEKTVRLLIEFGACVNVPDKYGCTPFMHACKNGHTAVVRMLLAEENIFLDAVDNLQCTAVFYAVENNRADIVRLLVEAGADCTIGNQKGYTPTQVADFHGFYDLLALLPKEKQPYMVPSQYLVYNSLRDYIPRIFLKADCPEYFQEIDRILRGMGMRDFLQYFARGQVSLQEFLCMNDKRLEELGIEFPIHRMKIMKGLLQYHRHHWNNEQSGEQVMKASDSQRENFYNILMVTANHMQHLVIINGTLRFIKDNMKEGRFGPLTLQQLRRMMRDLESYRQAIKDLKRTVKYLASFSPPKNPLYIDYNEYLAERKRSKLKRYVKYTTILVGVSVFVCLKAKNIF